MLLDTKTISFVAMSGTINSKDSFQNPRLRDHDPMAHLRAVNTLEYRVRSPRTSLILLKRLLAKVVYEPYSGYSNEELLILIEARDHLFRTKDVNFLAEYETDIKFCERLFSYVQWNIREAPLIKKAPAKKQFPFVLKWVKFCFLEDFGRLDIAKLAIGTAHAYFGWKATFQIKHALRKRLLFPRYSRKPARRYVGVGYRDKGNRKDPAYDGTPSWQEVLSAPTYHDLFPEFEDTEFERLFWLSRIKPSKYLYKEPGEVD